MPGISDETLIEEIEGAHGVSGRCATILWRYGIKTIGDLNALSYQDIRRLRGVGKKVLEEIQAMLVAAGHARKAGARESCPHCGQRMPLKKKP